MNYLFFNSANRMKINAFIFFFLASLVAHGQICFEPVKNYATSRNSPSDIINEYFNNDDYIDVVKSNENSNNISVLFGNGTEQYNFSNSFTTGAISQKYLQC